jgi:TolA-binding protein
MKPNIIPATCGIALALMCAAVATHWMSVRQLVALAGTTRTLNIPAPQSAPTALAHADPVAKPKPISPPPAAIARRESPPSPEQDKIDKLVSLVENLAHQNQDLREQMGETNRDLMDLQFRVDTQSESFRPLRTTQDPGTAYDQSPGVLPPRQQP